LPESENDDIKFTNSGITKVENKNEELNLYKNEGNFNFLNSNLRLYPKLSSYFL